MTEQVTVPMTKDQEDVYEMLRAEGREALATPGGGKGSKNILRVLGRMQFAALDLRLIDQVAYRDFSPPKYEALATKVLSSPGCVHIVFVSESRRESLDYCTEALVAKGVERSRIVTTTT